MLGCNAPAERGLKGNFTSAAYSCFLSFTAVPFNLPVLRAAISPTFCPGAASLLTVDA